MRVPLSKHPKITFSFPHSRNENDISSSLAVPYRNVIVNAECPALEIDQTIQWSQFAAQQFLPLAVIERVHAANIRHGNDTAAWNNKHNQSKNGFFTSRKIENTIFEK